MHACMRIVRAGLLSALPVIAACAPESLVEVTPPGTVVDASAVETPTGARQFYNSAVNEFSSQYGSLGSFTNMTAEVTDELMNVSCPSFPSGACMGRRMWSMKAGSGFDNPSNFLYHRVRIRAQQAREVLRLYAPSEPTLNAMLSRLYSLEGNAVLWFAEFYCSGIPLSTVSFQGVATPAPGLTTEQLYARAIALFDSAATLAGDSTRFRSLAQVGKGRALLGLGRFAEAATAVQGVPTDFAYAAEFNTATATNRFGAAPRSSYTQDNEGINGLVWSTDPRTAIVTTPSLSGAMPYSAKYSKTASGTLDPTQTINDNPIRVADGLEARLIEAEAALAAGNGNWLTILNTLRGTCLGTALCAPVPGLTAAQLPALADPGTPTARIDLLMRERAMWLFLTGHRFGDLRRLAHLYQRNPDTLWPTGTYNSPGFPPLIAAADANGLGYGNEIVITMEGTGEKELNPLYTGCFNNDP